MRRSSRSARGDLETGEPRRKCDFRPAFGTVPRNRRGAALIAGHASVKPLHSAATCASSTSRLAPPTIRRSARHPGRSPPGRLPWRAEPWSPPVLARARARARPERQARRVQPRAQNSGEQPARHPELERAVRRVVGARELHALRQPMAHAVEQARQRAVTCVDDRRLRRRSGPPAASSARRARARTRRPGSARGRDRAPPRIEVQKQLERPVVTADQLHERRAQRELGIEVRQRRHHHQIDVGIAEQRRIQGRPAQIDRVDAVEASEIARHRERAAPVPEWPRAAAEPRAPEPAQRRNASSRGPTLSPEPRRKLRAHPAKAPPASTRPAPRTARDPRGLPGAAVSAGRPRRRARRRAARPRSSELETEAHRTVDHEQRPDHGGDAVDQPGQGRELRQLSSSREIPRERSCP